MGEGSSPASLQSPKMPVVGSVGNVAGAEDFIATVVQLADEAPVLVPIPPVEEQVEDDAIVACTEVALGKLLVLPKH